MLRLWTKVLCVLSHLLCFDSRLPWGEECSAGLGLICKWWQVLCSSFWGLLLAWQPGCGVWCHCLWLSVISLFPSSCGDWRAHARRWFLCWCVMQSSHLLHPIVIGLRAHYCKFTFFPRFVVSLCPVTQYCTVKVLCCGIQNPFEGGGARWVLCLGMKWLRTLIIWCLPSLCTFGVLTFSNAWVGTSGEYIPASRDSSITGLTCYLMACSAFGL